MSKVALIGDKTSVLGFQALGFDAYPVTEPREARNIWSEVKDSNYTVIMVTEEIYREIEDLLIEFADKFTPAVLIIPPAKGGQGVGFQRMKKIVEKAVGMDILSEEGKG
ncbi:V-type ATP synthase subunit F [Candidatus Oleimmundimicrobium sp.]|uniref:V-type ATP synthase subunit F n=1 Tax=Candidatus Oleimmundimicrobium sp. TaxID=3060597 RepID=UPI002727157B|nr:V-type ATP synthase subunit F [Candidatus Oleimmundimicrobium sp.]MDO8886284.1 V-type ATP synthase subunit F [Candidatus Oleimmundimicrobium sp.]